MLTQNIITLRADLAPAMPVASIKEIILVHGECISIGEGKFYCSLKSTDFEANPELEIDNSKYTDWLLRIYLICNQEDKILSIGIKQPMKLG